MGLRINSRECRKAINENIRDYCIESKANKRGSCYVCSRFCFEKVPVRELDKFRAVD